MIKIVRAKLHGIFVSDSNLNYHGSITLDPEICHKAKIYPLEYVEIWNKNNGQRFSTYVIYGEAGSRCCILNGAAARCCQQGDEIIVAASAYVHSPQEICQYKPIVLTFDTQNSIKECLYYQTWQDATGLFQFAIEQGEEG